MKFRVIDRDTGEAPDLKKIVLEEEWADGLIYYDILGFVMDEDGDLLLMDDRDCGSYRCCPAGRFKVDIEEEDQK